MYSCKYLYMSAVDKCMKISEFSSTKSNSQLGYTAQHIRLMCPAKQSERCGFWETEKGSGEIWSEGDIDRRENQYAAHYKSSYINVNYLIIYSVECLSYEEPFSSWCMGVRVRFSSDLLSMSPLCAHQHSCFLLSLPHKNLPRTLSKTYRHCDEARKSDFNLTSSPTLSNDLSLSLSILHFTF